jgi:hypothetical protein
MKNKSKWILILLVVFSCGRAMAQTNAEAEIRNLENRQIQAVQKGDTATLYKTIWAPEFHVNNPSNHVLDGKSIAGLIATRKIDFESLNQTIDLIYFIDNTAIVMGGEVVKPRGIAENAGKTVTRRFTNIWMKRGNAWKQVGRQSTIISIQ